MRQPQVGEVVHYSIEGTMRPAVVTGVSPDHVVNLRVILDVREVDAGDVAEYWTRDWLIHTGFMPPESGVNHDAAGDGGTWRFVDETNGTMDYDD